ncbi:radical SAM protein [Peterkaempfera bronchialis]|uniref:Radical SAM protein n=1 Tax=Peterkaempfera bronchialis TaxID=2126346 RepID=A0A345SZM1_9ACTN|nr:radical SAM protein [Peterkaempfera bronchialis]AXI79176.1 radical SAM protein [Peterkaempfera bronchialis]
MRLADLLALRPVPGAGLLLTLTRRCPLRCAHCSTASTMAAEQVDGAALLRFVRSFTAADRPEVVLLTGGEPLLRPELAADLAAAARTAGTRSALLSGLFFAREDRIPARILRAVTAVDHFSASLDAFHEREVPRAAAFRAVHQVLDAGVPASFHLTGTGADDPYLADATAAVRREFGDRAPMLVNEVRAVGRAAGWAATARTGAADPGAVQPCAMAAWPVVAFDGAVVACCNQDVVDRRPAPAHLLLGRIADDPWPVVRARAAGSPLLRMVRAVGPDHLYARYGGDPAPNAAEDCCTGCRRLSERPAVADAARRAGAGPVGELLDREAARLQYQAGPVALARRWGCAGYADLVAPGHPLPETAGATR